MDEPFDAVSFLMRSRNRLAILQAVTVAPKTRQALVSSTGCSRVTVGRILRQFEDRDWVTHDGQTYEGTTEGRTLATVLSGLLEDLAGLERFEPLLSTIEIDALALPRGALADATVTTTDPTQPFRPLNRLTDLGAAASRVRMYAVGMTPDALESHLDLVRSAGQDLEIVTTHSALESVRATSALQEPLAELVETNAVVAVGPPDPDLAFVARFDDHAVIGAATKSGTIAGIAEWSDDRMLAWADARLDARLADAERITPESVAD
jgi:predicted transcriptional regulator